MKQSIQLLSVTRIRDVKQAVGCWIRLARHKQDMTQPLLSAHSGVPTSTLSRLERTGEGGMDSWLRVLQALGELEGLNAHVQERMRLAGLPNDLSDRPSAGAIRQRVRPQRAPGEVA